MRQSRRVKPQSANALRAKFEYRERLRAIECGAVPDELWETKSKSAVCRQRKEKVDVRVPERPVQEDVQLMVQKYLKLKSFKNIFRALEEGLEQAENKENQRKPIDPPMILNNITIDTCSPFTICTDECASTFRSTAQAPLRRTRSSHLK